MSSLSISFGYVRCSKSARDLRGRARDAARLHAGRMRAAVPELGGGERAVLVEHVAHEPEVLDVVVVPEARGDPVRVVGLRMDGAVLRTDCGVATLGLHGPEVRLVEGLLRPEPVAVGDLVEAVLHGLRADLDRLEEDVVLRVTRHSRKPPLDRTGTGILVSLGQACKRQELRAFSPPGPRPGRAGSRGSASQPSGRCVFRAPSGWRRRQAGRCALPGRPRGPS